MSQNNSDELAAVVADLQLQIQALERRLGKHSSKNRTRTIVAFISLVLLFIAGGLVAHLTDSLGFTLRQYMDYSSPHVVPPPLGTMVRWQRRNPPDAPLGSTNQILSLIAEANQTNSHTWPLYIQLSATDAVNATQATSGSVGAYVRAFNRSIGSPWLAAYHSEIYHGFTALGGQQVEAAGTSILYNGEMLTKSRHGVTIGLNLQNTPDSTGSATHAINIQSANNVATWQNGLHFDGHGVVGNVGVNFDGARFQSMGIDLADNSLKLNANQRVYLDATGKTYISYNTAVGRIEFVRAGQRVGVW